MSMPTGQPAMHVGFLHCRQPLGFLEGHLLRVAESYLVEVASALGRVLFGHADALFALLRGAPAGIAYVWHEHSFSYRP